MERYSVSNQLMRNRLPHFCYQECPAYVLQDTLVSLLDEVMNIVAVSPRRLFLTKRHITDTTCDLHNLFNFGCSRRAGPFRTFLLKKGTKGLNVKSRTSYQIYFRLHGC